jgi:hypothetical protein
MSSPSKVKCMYSHCVSTKNIKQLLGKVTDSMHAG